MAELVDLQEQTKETLVVADNHLVIPAIGHSKFVTIYVEFE